MKISPISITAIIFVVIAVAVAGCSSTSPAAPATGVPTISASPAPASPSPAGGVTMTTAPAAGSVVNGASLFGSTASYNWIEYKSTVSGMTVYMKFDRVKGTCTMRFEGTQPQGMPSEMSCGSTGGQTQNNPNTVASDVKYTFVGIEPVSVPAGTYPTASKYSLTSSGQTMYYWTAPGVPGFVKYQMSTSDGLVTTELNGWG